MQTQLKDLIIKKDEMQAKIAELDKQIKHIDEVNKFDKGVVDAEGFPRADLDFGQLANYRNLKRQKAELNNDHFALMKQIEKRMFQLHKTFPDVDPLEEQVKPKEDQQKSTTSKVTQHKQKEQQKKQHNIDYLTPFAKLSIVSPHSPSQKAGLKVNDLLSQFSEVNIYTIDFLKQIPKYVKQGKPIKVIILREVEEDLKGQQIFKLKDGKNYKKIAFQVIPSTWEGKGLLGCKIDPLH